MIKHYATEGTRNEKAEIIDEQQFQLRGVGRPLEISRKPI